MNPYSTFSEILFTCVDGPKIEVVDSVLTGFNKGKTIKQYFAKEVEGDLPFPYIDRAERDTTKTQRIVFWEPRNRPGVTAFMGIFQDGLSHSVFRLSEYSHYTWINVRIYADSIFPGCFFDYYTDHRKIERILMAVKDEEGWEFLQSGPIQPFENAYYYSRRLIRDRLNREIITEYLNQLGYFVNQDSFWQPNNSASLLWQERPQ